MISSIDDIQSTGNDHMVSIVLLIVGILILYLMRTGKYDELKKVWSSASEGVQTPKPQEKGQPSIMNPNNSLPPLDFMKIPGVVLKPIPGIPGMNPPKGK
jgi:hypothetical protein